MVVGSGVKLQSGTFAAWNAGRGQSRWELPTAVWETISLSHSLTHTPTLPSPTKAQKRRAVLRDRN